jgi:hypothetical protein
VIEYRERKVRSRRRHKPKDRTYEDSRLSIAEWWAGALSSGALLDPEAVEGEDYAGEGPWPEWVTLRALHKQYTKDTGKSATRMEFCHRLRSIVGHPAGEGRYKLHRNKFGRITGIEYDTIYKVDWLFRDDPLDSSS